jgi:hypothetical protein
VDDFAFTVNIVAVVRVRAAEESVARRVVPTVLGAPGTVELRLANEGNAVLLHRAAVTNVDFSIEEGSIKLIETNGVPAPAPAICPPRPRASHPRRVCDDPS